MNTTTTEKAGLPKRISIYQGRVKRYNQHAQLLAQRDELLAALKALCDFGFNTVTSRNANAAIASVEGSLSPKKGKGI